MGGGDCKPVFVHCCIRVQFRANTEDAMLSKIYWRPFRGNPPGKPDNVAIPDHRIVTPVQDLPVVGEEEICIPVQFCHCLINVRDHRVAGHVGTGHDEQRVLKVGEKQMMKSCIGQHAADGVEIADR